MESESVKYADDVVYDVVYDIIYDIVYDIALLLTVNAETELSASWSIPIETCFVVELKLILIKYLIIYKNYNDKCIFNKSQLWYYNPTH